MRNICLLIIAVLVAGAGVVANGSSGAAGTVAAQLAQAEPWSDDRSLGAADAPVTMIEYASLTCPHCASFHKETLPRLMEEYIDTGKVKLIYRDFPFDELALRAAMMARCAEPARFFGLIEVLFRGQDHWSRAKDPMAALRRIGRMAGMSNEKFDACMADRKVEVAILGGRLKAAREQEVNSTPTFFINGHKVAGNQPYEVFDEILRSLVPDS
ncbi:MAG: DsbA family protein [Kiloniellales bacterium]